WSVPPRDLRSFPHDALPILREGPLDALPEHDALRGFAGWFATERAGAARHSIEALIDRALERTGYDLAVLAMPGGRRRLANVRRSEEHTSELQSRSDLVCRL